jgi:hypothetical protein
VIKQNCNTSPRLITLSKFQIENRKRKLNESSEPFDLESSGNELDDIDNISNMNEELTDDANLQDHDFGEKRLKCDVHNSEIYQSKISCDLDRLFVVNFNVRIISAWQKSVSIYESYYLNSCHLN